MHARGLVEQEARIDRYLDAFGSIDLTSNEQVLDVFHTHTRVSLSINAEAPRSRY